MRDAEEATYHEIALDVAELLRQALLDRVVVCAVNLVVVVVEADDGGASELCNLASGAANAAANIEHPHARLEVHHHGKVVLVPGKRLSEGLAIGKAAEVEGVGPALLVHVGGQVVVVAGEGGIFVAACLADFGCLVGGRLVVPVLKVLVVRSIVGGHILVHHGQDAGALLGRLAMHELVEGSITLAVLLLKTNLGSTGSHGVCERRVMRKEGKRYASSRYAQVGRGGRKWVDTVGSLGLVKLFAYAACAASPCVGLPGGRCSA